MSLKTENLRPKLSFAETLAKAGYPKKSAGWQ